MPGPLRFLRGELVRAGEAPGRIKGHLESIVSAHGAFLWEPLGSLGCSLGVPEGPQAMPGLPGVGPWGALGGFMGCLWMILGVMGGPWGNPWAPRRVPGRVFKRSR